MTKTIQQIENNLQANIISHFKSLSNKEQKNEEVDNKLFDLVLVNIYETYYDIKCVKKNIYDPELKYICISYRWGELNEQLVETPDYTAHVTSFDIEDLKKLCKYINKEPDLCEIPYLWIDAISVNQQHHSRKKDTILKMNQIYQHASYILAVPDLHKGYLMKHPANKETIELIKNEYKETIYKEIFNNEHSDINTKNDNDTNSSITTNSIQQQHYNNDYYLIIQKLKNRNILSNDEIKKIEELEIINQEKEKEINELKMKMKEKVKEKKELEIEMINEEKKKIYQFLAYLIEDWSNRAWVISEYHIAKEKYINHETPLKYWFISLLDYRLDEQPFFSYHFNDDQQSTINNKALDYGEVNNPMLFNEFVKSRFMQRSHLEMILNSNATKNEDRFNAILPSWNKYNHLVKNKYTISDWNIADMTSVRLKLYEIMDLWDKAILLKACKYGEIFPVFASKYDMSELNIIEKLDYSNAIYKEFENSLLKYIIGARTNEESDKIKQLMDEYKMNSKSVWNENLTSIQFEPNHCYLSVKSNSYFIRNEDTYDKDIYQNKLSLDDNDKIHQAFIPFFTSNLPGYIDKPYIYKKGSFIFLIGNMKKNKWIFQCAYLSSYKSEHFCSDDYTFNLY